MLSACDTASGPLEGEEGVSTLANAFLLAGARTVVSALWPVEDESSRFLMNQFYKRLSEQRSPADSMAEAKRQMLKKFGRSHPTTWAAFVVEGSNLEGTEKRPTTHKFAAKVIFLILIAALGLCGHTRTNSQTTHESHQSELKHVARTSACLKKSS